MLFRSFNGGSALAADGSAGAAMLATHLSAAAGGLTWMVIEWRKFGKPSTVGLITGVVAGLATITPASGHTGPLAAIAIGIAAGLLCFAAVRYIKVTLKIDDSLDVTPVHGVGGVIGTLMTGIFASAALGGVGYPEGMTMASQVGVQLVGMVAIAAWSGILSWILLKLTDALTGMRVDAEEETEGLDTVLHNETGYNL